MLSEAKSSERSAVEGNVDVNWERLWNIEPILFDEDLVSLCDEAIAETGARPHRLPSGRCTTPPKSRALAFPTVMMFVQSLHGISHNKIEDTKEERTRLAVRALDKQFRPLAGL